MVDISPELLQEISDSLNVLTPKVALIAQNSSPIPYVTNNLIISKINLVVSIIAVIFGFLGYKWSKKTAKHVSPIDATTQLVICDDIVQELYKRLVYACAILSPYYKAVPDHIIASMKFTDFNYYFRFEDYRNNPKQFSLLLEIKQRMTGYNEHLNLCIEHLATIHELADPDKLYLINQPIKILARLSILCENISGKQYASRLLAHIAHLHYYHLRNESANSYNWIQFYNDPLPINSDSYTIAITKLLEKAWKDINARKKEFSSIEKNITFLADYMKDDHTFSKLKEQNPIFHQGNLSTDNFVKWFSVALEIDSAIELPKLS